MSTVADRAGPDTAEESDLTLRDQLACLQGILALSSLMGERADEDAILHLATTAVPALGRCRLVGVYLLGLGWRSTVTPGTRPELRAEIQAQLARLHGDGPLTIAGDRWGWATALRCVDDHLGFLVVSATGPPSAAELFLLRALGQQTGTALAHARVLAQERRTVAELRGATTELAGTVATLRHESVVHHRLTQVAVAGGGQQGVAAALHELTGFPVAVEDRYGNLLAWAGPDDGPSRRRGGARRDRLVARAVAAGRPIRAGGRLVVAARARDDIIAVLALVDPEGRAGEAETVALEHGSTVLAIELARLRGVAETELRLGRDVVAELIGDGPADGGAAVGIARAMGYDLDRPHRVLVLGGTAARPGPIDGDALLHAVRRVAAGRGLGSLLLARGDGVVLVAPDAGPVSTADWDGFRRSVADELGVPDARVHLGVGGVAMRPADLARSHHEARLAQRLPGGAGRAVGPTAVYDDLGIYQLLAEVADTSGVHRFVRRWLGALVDHDERRGSGLVVTLSCFLECGGHYDVTARALGIGRSTLRYRLQSIRQISGHDLSDTDTRFNLHLATRAWTTLET